MAQTNKHQVVPFVEGQVVPPELTLGQPRQQRERVVQGTNEPVSPEFLKQAIFGWLMFLGGVGILLLLLSIGMGWSMGVVFTTYLILSILVSLSMWRVVLPYMTGDNVAEKEIRKERDVELAHTAAQRDVALKYLDVKQSEIDTHREVELARIQYQQDQLDISQRLARLEQAQLDSLHMLPADRGRSFVPAHDQSAKLRVHEWVAELYDNPDAITSNGKVRAKMPQWSREEEAYILKLFEAPSKQGEWWQVVYDDKFSALTALNNMDKGE